MRKRVKKLNLNQSTKSHDKLLIKNLFTSLMMYGKVTTTKPRAQALKGYTLSKATEYTKLASSIELKRWLKAEFSTQQYAERVAEKMKTLAKTMAVSTVMTQPRKGDNAPQYEVTILNYDAPKNE